MKKKQDINNENKLTEEELAMLKGSIDATGEDRSKMEPFDTSDKARFLRYAKSNRVFMSICAVLMALIIITLALCGALIGSKLAGRENKDDFTVIIGDDDYTAKYSDVVKDGVVYVDMYKIAQFASLTVSGGKTTMKFTSDEYNYLKFENDSNEAVINGALVDLGGRAEISQKQCLVPFEFLSKAVGNGLKLTLDRDTNTIKVQRHVYATEDKDVFIPVEILFYSDAFTTLISIDQVKDDYNFEYAIDVSAFLPFIDPDNASDYMILANKQNPLGKNYAPSDLVKVESNTKGKICSLRSDAERALYALMLDMQSAYITDTFITSAYRSYSYQEDLFASYVADEMRTISNNATAYFGEEYIYEHYISKGIGTLSEEDATAVALSYSAEAGKSEHQTGLCVDFMTNSMSDLDESFEDTAAFEWLSKNAHKYGFILRYPKNKTDITCYKYEPWHYRFVGRRAATEIYKSGLCLEEYLRLS